MKTIIEPVEGETVGIEMERLVVMRSIDNESVFVHIPFWIGGKEFIVKGQLNVSTNMFHWDSENEKELQPYFEGFEKYGLDIVSAVENR